MRLENQVALITGAGQGIGRAISEKYAKEGAKVVISDVDSTAAEEAAWAIRQDGCEAMALAMDVTDEGAVANGVDAIVKEWGTVDILVANAGIQHLEPLHTVSFANWRRVISINLDGAFLVTCACLRYMYAARKGSIIYIGSVHSKEASSLKGPYVAAKHALLGLCRTVAKEGAEYGVRSNIICPGFVRTDLIEKQIPNLAEQHGISEDVVIKDIFLSTTVDKEFTTVDDLSEVALHLASFPSNALTGQSVVVSHGWHME